MVEEDILEEKMNERKEKFKEQKEKVNEKTSEQKDRYEETKEKTRMYSDKISADLNKTLEDFKENFKNMQKLADDKINEYKNATVSNIAVDLVEFDDVYYLKAAVPGLSKEEVDIEASDNDIVISATFKPLIEELPELLGVEELENAKSIASELKSGKCSKTVRFENSIEPEKIKAKYSTGIIIITIPKLIIPKHKVTVE
ncbi:MAG: Hsp20/alpha crystallin family protein [Methanobrevibacter sp.]|nr:Hsp20/alpha crystallin family protein [Methanobrevibacter sp.]